MAKQIGWSQESNLLYQISALITRLTQVTAANGGGGGSFVPYTGATGPVNLGAYNLTVNGVTIGRGISNINKNTVVGKDAFLLNTTGDNNVALGAGTLASSSTGDFNTSVGTEALQYNTVGSYNVAVGGFAMRNNTSGILNTVVGTTAMLNSTTGNNNSVFGNAALYYNIGGSENSAFGYQAGFYNTSGIQNTAVGLYALYSNGVGDFNTAIGGYSGNTATSGSYNISIGYQSGLGNVTGSNNTIVGSRVTGLPVGLSNNIILADGQGNIKYRWDGVGNTITGDLAVTGVLRPTITTNRQTASYTLAIADRGKLVEMNVAIANNLTIPLDSTVSFPIGTQLEVAQYGAGQTTIVGAVGVTIRSASGNLKIASQYVAVSLIKIATNEWYVFGQLSA